VKKQRSHCGRNPWNFQFNPILMLTSAEKDYIISQVLTSLWSGGDNSMPGKQLNPQIQCHINNIDRPDEEE